MTQLQPSPNPETVVISLGVTDGIEEQFEGFEWDFNGYDLVEFEGDLRDIKKATALLSATLQPQLSTLETIRIARDQEDDQIYLVLVLKETFEHLQIQLGDILKQHAQFSFSLKRVSHRIIPVQELAENGDLVIPAEAVGYLTEPLVFDRLSIDTEEESFLHTF